MPYLTFVTPNPEKDFDLWIKKSHPDITIDDRVILDDHAVRWAVEKTITKEVLDAIRHEFKIDILQTEGTPIKLFMADMDSTIVSGETLDDMAALCGIGEQIASITDRAMRGELDFEAALNERVALLKGMSVSIIDQALNEMCLNNGAEALLKGLKSKEIYCVLISGGFTQFTSYIADQLGFDAHYGNVLLTEPQQDVRDISFLGQGAPAIVPPDQLVLSGEVQKPILDKHFKHQKLKELQSKMNLEPSEIMAIGDGANDLSMLQAAGVGVAYFGKPLLQETLINQINYTDLSSLIYLI
jgi:phosphoserine phosphatase